MNLNTLSNALPIVAAAYGRKFGVPIQVGGDTAATDGQSSTFPPSPMILAPRTWHGAIWPMKPAMSATRTFARGRRSLGQPLTRAITNILEDVRIENAMIGSYPGTTADAGRCARLDDRRWQGRCTQS